MTNVSSAPADDEPELTFKEKIQSLNFGKVPGGGREGKFVYRKPPDPVWERGIAGETRSDGSFWPHLHADAQPIRQKEWSENRRKYERNIRESRAGNPPE